MQFVRAIRREQRVRTGSLLAYHPVFDTTGCLNL